MIDRYLHKTFMNRNLLVALLIILGTMVSCTMNDRWEDHYMNVPARIEDNVLHLIGQDQDYSMFYDALVNYGFEEMLSRNQYFTIFAPVNAAFDEVDGYTDEEWKNIIGFHILYAKIFSKDFRDADLLTTIGKYLKMEDHGNNEFTISGSGINMSRVDEYCQNGVVHQIDRLLIPKPNVYEYIMMLDSSYSILQEFLHSMDERYIDYEKSERIGVDDNGNAIYDTIWREENYFLDHIAGLNREEEAFTGFLPTNDHVRAALDAVSEYFGEIGDLDEGAYNQLLFITFSGSFVHGAYMYEDIPDSVASVTGKPVEKERLSFGETDLEVSNGIIHLLEGMTIPKSYFLLPITIECDQKKNRTVSDTKYPIEQRSDTRASNGSFVWYGCQFVGDYLEFAVDMVLKTTYWIEWTGPKQGPSHYQISVKDEDTGEFVPVGDPVNNWTKGNFVVVKSGSYTFTRFGTKSVRITIVDELPLVGYNSIYVDYIKLIPDEIYEQ
jgi:uncharacterized surface protein with fasciclin (FAS1) repeats